MRIAFYSTKKYDRESFEKHLPASGHEVSFFETKLDQRSAILAQNHDVICSFVNDQVDAPCLESIASLGIRLIALRCAGYNHVDSKKAKSLGITIVRVPAYSPEAVAEHAFALILTLSRKTHKAYNRVRESNFSLEGLTGFTLHNKTVGVIGTGAIGRAFCKIARGFGMTVLAFDILEDEAMKAIGVRYCSLDELLKSSQIISLHCPLTTTTNHLIDTTALKKMQPRTMLINTSRGALIDTPAVINALQEGKIGFLGIDVYEQEEDLFFQNLSEEILQDEQITRLMTFPNVLITGHQAFLTREALDQIAITTLANITEYESNLPLTNSV